MKPCLLKSIEQGKTYSQPMFPLRRRARTLISTSPIFWNVGSVLLQRYWNMLECKLSVGREMSAHKDTWSAHKNFFRKCTIFLTLHSTNRFIVAICCTKKFYAHTDFKKLEGTLFTATLLNTHQYHAYSENVARICNPND